MTPEEDAIPHDNELEDLEKVDLIEIGMTV